MGRTATETRKCPPMNSDTKNGSGLSGGKDNSAATIFPEATEANEVQDSATETVDCTKTTVAGKLEKIPDEIRERIDELLRSEGVGVTVDEIYNHMMQQQNTIKTLEEKNQHQKEICDMLTRYRFCPHSEQKKMLAKLSGNIIKLIDQMELTIPELEGISDEVLDLIRSGEIELVTDENGKLILPTGYRDSETVPNNSNNGESSNGESSNGEPENGDDSNKHPGKDTSGDDSGKGKKKHARRTKGSLEKKFANVEHRKCYTSFDDVTGCKDHPPLDENGNPMVYVGEKHIRSILVRIPERYIMYECYSETFRVKTPEELAGQTTSDSESTADYETKTPEGTEKHESDPLVLAVTVPDEDFESALEFCEEMDEDSDDLSDEDTEEFECFVDGGTICDQDEKPDHTDTEEILVRVPDLNEDEDEPSDNNRRESSPENSSMTIPAENAEKSANRLHYAHIDGSMSSSVLPEEQSVETIDPRCEACLSPEKGDTCPENRQVDTVHDPPG